MTIIMIIIIIKQLIKSRNDIYVYNVTLSSVFKPFIWTERVLLSVLDGKFEISQ